jgi:integrase
MIYKRGNETTYTVAFRFAGRQISRQTGTADRAAAERILKQLKRDCQTGRAEVLDTYRLHRPSVEIVTLGQILERWQGSPCAAHRTIRAYTCGLRSLVRGGLQRELSDAEISALPVSTLTRELAVSFQRAVVAAAGTDETLIARSRTTANSVLQNARGLFSRRARDLYAGLPLPDLKAFLSTPRLPEPDHSFQPIADDVIARLWADAPSLADADPNAYRAFILSIEVGLRRAEIASLRWSDIGIYNGRLMIRIATSAGFRVKTGRPREIILHPQTLGELERLRKIIAKAPDDYVLDGHQTERYWATFARLGAWLKERGLSRMKAAHELRKECGARWADRFGDRIASRMLGNTPEVFRKHYDTVYSYPEPTPLPLARGA